MEHLGKTTVLMSGQDQHVIIPAGYRFSSDEVYVRRDPLTGDLILSESPSGWHAFFAALDEDRFPNDFLTDRAQGTSEDREEL